MDFLLLTEYTMQITFACNGENKHLINCDVQKISIGCRHYKNRGVKPTFDISWYSCSSDCSASKIGKKGHQYSALNVIKLCWYQINRFLLSWWKDYLSNPQYVWAPSPGWHQLGWWSLQLAEEPRRQGTLIQMSGNKDAFNKCKKCLVFQLLTLMIQTYPNNTSTWMDMINCKHLPV